MKTIIIYDQGDVEAITFFVHDGDVSELDGHYVNSVDDEGKDDMLLGIVEQGEKLASFPIDIVKAEDVKVIVCGFLP